MSGDVDRYRRYFLQVGGGDIGPVYRSSYYKQRGRGLGNFFRGLWKFVKPLVTGGIKAVGREARDTGIRVLSDIGTGKPIKEVFQERSMEAIDNLKRKAEDKISRMTGAGLRAPKRARIKYSRNKIKKVKKKQVGRGRGRKQKKMKKKRKRIRDIFA